MGRIAKQELSQSIAQRLAVLGFSSRKTGDVVLEGLASIPGLETGFALIKRRAITSEPLSIIATDLSSRRHVEAIRVSYGMHTEGRADEAIFYLEPEVLSIDEATGLGRLRTRTGNIRRFDARRDILVIENEE